MIAADEGIGLDVNGLVSEGAGENIFVVSDGVIRTPPTSSSILSGLTRDAVIKLAEADGFVLREQTLSRESLYVADEIFFTGTAAEITPVRSVDGHVVRCGGRGPGRRADAETLLWPVQWRDGRPLELADPGA